MMRWLAVLGTRPSLDIEGSRTGGSYPTSMSLPINFQVRGLVSQLEWVKSHIDDEGGGKSVEKRKKKPSLHAK